MGAKGKLLQRLWYKTIRIGRDKIVKTFRGVVNRGRQGKPTGALD